MTSNQVALQQEPRFGRELRKDFLFEEGYVNLNHGEWFSDLFVESWLVWLGVVIGRE